MTRRSAALSAPIIVLIASAASAAETLKYTFPSQVGPADEYVAVVRTLSGDALLSVSLK